MENRLLENRLLVENGHSRNRQFAGVATALILLSAAVVCVVVTYKVGPGAGAYDAVEMSSKSDEEEGAGCWKQTGGCDPLGGVESEKGRKYDVLSDASGYCVCDSGQTVYKGCWRPNGPTFTCESACSAAVALKAEKDKRQKIFGGGGVEGGERQKTKDEKTKDESGNEDCGFSTGEYPDVMDPDSRDKLCVTSCFNYHRGPGIGDPDDYEGIGEDYGEDGEGGPDNFNRVPFQFTVAIHEKNRHSGANDEDCWYLFKKGTYQQWAIAMDSDAKSEDQSKAS